MALVKWWGPSLILLVFGGIASFIGWWMLASAIGVIALLTPVVVWFWQMGATYRSLRFLMPLIGGILLGWFWADAIFWDRNGEVMRCVERSSVAESCVNTINLPAFGSFYLLVAMGVGPSGDAGWNMVPWCVIAQWTVVGGLLGLLFFRRHWDKDRNRGV